MCDLASSSLDSIHGLVHNRVGGVCFVGNDDRLKRLGSSEHAGSGCQEGEEMKLHLERRDALRSEKCVGYMTLFGCLSLMEEGDFLKENLYTVDTIVRLLTSGGASRTLRFRLAQICSIYLPVSA